MPINSYIPGLIMALGPLLPVILPTFSNTFLNNPLTNKCKNAPQKSNFLCKYNSNLLIKSKTVINVPLIGVWNVKSKDFIIILSLLCDSLVTNASE